MSAGLWFFIHLLLQWVTHVRILKGIGKDRLPRYNLEDIVRND